MTVTTVVALTCVASRVIYPTESGHTVTHCAIVTLGLTRRCCAPTSARRSSSEKERTYYTSWYLSGIASMAARFAAHSPNGFGGRSEPNSVVSTAMSLNALRKLRRQWPDAVLEPPLSQNS